MSSKKKALRERVDAKAVQNQTLLLEGDKPTLIAANDYPLCSDAINIDCGRPYGALNHLDWVAFTDWLDEVPQVEVADQLLHYASENLRDPENQSLPPFRLKSMKDEEKLKFIAQHWTRRELRQLWQRIIIQRLRSPLLYPRHSVSFSYSACLQCCTHDSSHAAFNLASAIVNLIRAHCEAGNMHSEQKVEQMASYASAYDPRNDFRKILGHSLHCTGLVTHKKEEKDVVFGSSSIDLEAALSYDDPEAPQKPKLTLTSHFESTYVNVCCGKYYYQLPVLDGEKHCIKSADSIGAALDMIYDDVKVREAAFDQLNISEESKNDLREFYSLLGRMTAVSDFSDSDIQRRLCEASEVNEYNLGILEGALFTVVIDGPTRPSERVDQSQWLHSLFSLYFQWKKPLDFTVSAVAIFSGVTLLSFLKKRLAKSSESGSTAESVNHSLLPPSEESSSVGQDKQEPGSFLERSSFVVSNAFLSEKRFQIIEFWLAAKHRKALLPYAPLSPSRTWISDWFHNLSSSFTGDISVAQLCVAAVLAIERVLFNASSAVAQTSRTRRPCVLFVYHHPECMMPSVMSLLTSEVEAYIQAVRNPSSLVTSFVRSNARDQALRSVKARIQEAIDSPISLYGLSRTAFEWEKETVADLCISCHMLSYTYRKQSGSFQVKSVGADLGIASNLLLNGTAVQVTSQKKVIVGDGAVCHGELGINYGLQSFAEAFVEAIALEIRSIGLEK